MKKDLTSRTKQLQSIEFRLNRLDQNRKSIGLPLNTSQLLTELEGELPTHGIADGLGFGGHRLT